MKKMFKILLIIIVILLIAFGAYYVYKMYTKNKESSDGSGNIFKQEEKKVQIYDEGSNERNVAVMLDNNTHAWPHSGINSAYLIYEMEVEGGESRLMALFKNKQDLDKVGPIRSARHYFLNYALENDAIYAHIGQSPKAEKDLKILGVADINGQIYDSAKSRNDNNTREFWREKSKDKPHNAYTSIRNIFEIAKKLEYNLVSEKGQIFKYSVDEIELDKDSSVPATEVTAGYSGGTNNITTFTYDEAKKAYTKTNKGVKQVDEITKEDYTAKNIIIIKAKTTYIDDKRLDVKTVGENQAYYITNGRCEEITAKKDSREAKTKFLRKDGSEITLNDGRTYVMVVRDDYNVKIEGEEEVQEEPSNENMVVE